VIARSLATLAVVSLSMVLAAPGAGAADPAPSTVRWEGGAGAGTLVLQLERPASAVESRLAGSQVELLLENATIPTAGLPEGVRVFREGSTTRLRLERPGLSVRSVRVEGATVTVALSVAAVEPPAADTYGVGVGDVLAVSVYNNPDLSGEFTVAPDGSISMPLLGAIPVAGQGEAAIRAEVTKRLVKDFLVDPQVSVSVKTYQSQYVYVTGAVPRASRIPVRSGLTLRGALAEAGAAISPGITVELRRASGEVTMLDAAKLDGADAPLPKDRDVLTVQQSNFVSIYGEVRRSSRLALTPEMTLLQAIAMAEGLTDWANKKKVKILRKNATGTEEMLVNLGEVEGHKVPDPRLQPEDVIIVGRRIL
jgi:polysaccharide export outer membrane protein